MAVPLDKRALGAKKGGIMKSIAELEKAGKSVPQKKRDDLSAVNAEIENLNKALKAGQGKTASGKTVEQSLLSKASKKAEKKANKKGKDKEDKETQRTMLDEGLDFSEEEESTEAFPFVLETPKKGDSYEELIELPVVVQFPDGKAAEIVAHQKRSSLDQTFWGKVSEHVATIEGYMEGFDVPVGFNDNTGLKVSAALFPSLLGEDGTLKYTAEGGRVTKAAYKAFLERVAHNVNTLVANRLEASFSKENPMIRTRISNALMNEDDRSTTITMEEHSAILITQYAYLVSAVETARRKLVAHGIAISNLAEKTIHQRWEVTCIAAALLKTIRQKDAAFMESEGHMEVEGHAETEGPAETFLDPEDQEFKEDLTLLMLKYIKAHECLCMACNPGYADTIYDQAQAEAEKFVEQTVTTEARLDLYNAAVKRYKEEVDAVVLEKIQDEMRDQIRKEVVAEYQGELKAQFEQQLTDGMKAAMKKDVREEYEAMLSRTRSGTI